MHHGSFSRPGSIAVTLHRFLGSVIAMQAHRGCQDTPMVARGALLQAMYMRLVVGVLLAPSGRGGAR